MSDLDKAFSQYLIDKETPPPPPASETTDENDMSFGDYLDQVTTTISDIPDMAVRGALRGLGETAFTLGIIDEPQIEKYRKAMDASSKLAVTEGSNPIVSSLGEGVSQIGVTALPAFRALRAMGMGRTSAGLVAEAVGGAVSVNPDDPNLGNLAQALMGEDRSGPFADAMDILATNPEDPAIMNRARNAIQDSTIGLAFEGLIRSPGAARAMVDRWNSGRSAIPFGEMRENIAEAGARADERLKSTMSGSTLSANPVGAMGDMAVSAAGRLARVDAPEEQARMVSARYPTAVKKDEDPVATQLNIGYDAVAADQKVLQRNTDVLRIYPGLRPNASADAEEFGRQFIDDVKQNIIYLHNRVPEQTRQRSKLWYDGANKIAQDFSAKYKVPDTSVAGVMAALSPQKDWFMNVSLAERTLDVLSNQKSFVFSDEMAGRMEQIFAGPKYAALREMMTGKTLDDLTDPIEKAFFVRIHDETYADRSHRIITPEGNFGDVVLTDKGEPSGTGWGSLVEISKAVRAYESGGDRSLMTEILGTKHKVRSFYNNIIEPNSANGDVTIDTHAVAAALLRPLSGNSREVHHNFGSTPMKAKQPEGWQGAANSSKTGVQGTYGLYAEAYRQAAAELGILPRELQSITWEAVRGLFTDRFKSGKNNVSDINAIWSQYSSGKLSIDEVRNAVEERAGGIDAPSWQ